MIKPPERVLLRIREDNKVKQCLAYGEHSILGGDGGGGGSHSNNYGDHTGRVRTRNQSFRPCVVTLHREH